MIDCGAHPKEWQAAAPWLQSQRRRIDRPSLRRRNAVGRHEYNRPFLQRTRACADRGV